MKLERTAIMIGLPIMALDIGPTDEHIVVHLIRYSPYSEPPTIGDPISHFF